MPDKKVSEDNKKEKKPKIDTTNESTDTVNEKEEKIVKKNEKTPTQYSRLA